MDTRSDVKQLQQLSDLPPEKLFTLDDIQHTETYIRIKERLDALTPSQKSYLEIFSSGAMSYGSISLQAHRDIAFAMNIIACLLHGARSVSELRYDQGPFSNSGEGGEIVERNGRLDQSRIRQVASGHFGVNEEFLSCCNWIQDKIVQAAKFSQGGMLKGVKVTEKIAKARFVAPGTTLESPAPLHDQYSIEDHKQKHHDFLSANPEARISVKIGANHHVGPIAIGSAKSYTANIEVAGIGGGTGAVKTTGKYDLGHPWEKALHIAHCHLTREGLRDRVTLTVSGGIQTAFDCAMALIFSAQMVSIGTSILNMLGCVNAKDCHTGECPAGIATQNPEYLEKYQGKPEHIVNALCLLVEDIDCIFAPYGIYSAKESCGRTDLLKVIPNAPFADLEELLKKPENPYADLQLSQPVEARGSSILEEGIIDAIQDGQKTFHVAASSEVVSFGARIHYHIVRDKNFAENFADPFSPITITFNGVAMGQSFGYVAPPQLTLIAERANDGVGKSLDGATLVIKDSIGNSAGFGGTRGELYVKSAGDRFLVRNSGILAVSEEIGDMGANFMTNGKLILCGPFGANFAAGFSGGTIYILKELYANGKKLKLIAHDALQIEPQEVTSEDQLFIEEKLLTYCHYIQSAPMQDIIDQKQWDIFYKLDPKKRQAPVPTGALSQLPAEPRQTLESALEKVVVVPSMAMSPEEKREKDNCGTGILMQRDKQSTRETADLVFTMLDRVAHRGFVGSDPKTGDGCGIAFYGLTDFFQKQFPSLSLQEGQYCIIPIYLSKNTQKQQTAIALLHQLLEKESLYCAGERLVQVNSEHLGPIGQSLISPLKQFVVLSRDGCDPTTFEKRLVRTRLRFELTMQLENRGEEQKRANRPYMLSSSLYFVTYTSLTPVKSFRLYFQDFDHPDFMVYGGAIHARAATNSAVNIMNVQPLGWFMNNGENNALNILINWLVNQPIVKEILDIPAVHLDGFSDSNIMSMMIAMFYLFDYSVKEIIQATVRPYIPSGNRTADYYQLMGLPFVGPCAGIVMAGGEIGLFRDTNAFRPLVGIENDRYIFAGSEWGMVELAGKTLRFKPGLPYVMSVHEPSIQLTQYDFQTGIPIQEDPAFQLQNTAKKEPDNIAALRYMPQEIARRKARAGWYPQTHASHMKPLLANEPRTESMGDQNPLEVTVSDVEIGALMKGNFAQITNPPLTVTQERPYMFMQVFLGKKPSLQHLKDEQGYQGVYLPLPILSNKIMADIMHSDVLKPAILDIHFQPDGTRDAETEAVQHIIERAFVEVKNGALCLVLSDCAIKGPAYTSLDGVRVASALSHALEQAGIRHEVGIVLQTIHVFGRDMAQAISVGCVDAINPYLAELALEETGQYTKALTNVIGDFMGCLGNPSITAYRGSKEFSFYGVNSDIAKLYGIETAMGGIGWEEYLQILDNTYSYPEQFEKNNKYAKDGDQKYWHPTVSINGIIASRDNNRDAWNKMQAAANRLKKGFPRGWFQFKPSTEWNTHNPMPICILGGGAAGFLQAQSLLNTSLPVLITIIEQQYVNRFGLVGDGVAPDHSATKNQQRILKECLDDKRVTYVGGLTVTEELLTKLQLAYPCVIDCRGAQLDNKLAIPGEELSEVMPASQVYRAYNKIFKLNDRPDWPFHNQSRNKKTAIIGVGNVAADLARILLSDIDQLVDTMINETFLSSLKDDPFYELHIYARGAPHQAKISLQILEELQERGIALSAEFEPTSAQEKNELVQFFDRIQDQDITAHPKRLYFHFGHQPIAFYKQGLDIKISFKEKPPIIVRHVVTALGTYAEKSPCEYVTGWAAGQGGTLALTGNSAEQTTKQIETDFKNRKFHGKPLQPMSSDWMLKAPVTTQGMLNILNYLHHHRTLLTIADFKIALHYGERTTIGISMEEEAPFTLPDAVPGEIVVSDQKGMVHHIPLEQDSTTGSLLKILNGTLPKEGKRDPVKHECDGKGICGTCVVRAPQTITRTKQEKSVLRAQGKDPEKYVLTCLHTVFNKHDVQATVDIEDLVTSHHTDNTTNVIQSTGLGLHL